MSVIEKVKCFFHDHLWRYDSKYYRECARCHRTERVVRRWEWYSLKKLWGK